MKITVNVNSRKSIQKAIKELKAYRNDLERKTELFISRLLDVGIEVAERYGAGETGPYGTHKMERYVTFSKKLESDKYGCKGILMGKGATLYSEWIGEGGEKRSGSINSMLAMEFGTAGLALPKQDRFGVTAGRGTNSKYGHENDVLWYILVEENGNTFWKTATAITPTRPMHNAMIEMQEQVKAIAKEVFGDG